MAKQKDQPIISVPVGSRAEVEDLDPSLLRTVATCSEHTNENMGCASWEDCDLAHKGERPHNMPYRFFKEDGSSRETAGHCMHIVRQRTQIEANKGFLQIIGDEGDSYTMSGTERVHPIRDTTCPACMRNECNAHRPLSNPQAVVKPLPPAGEHKDLAKYVIMRDLRKRREENRRSNAKSTFFNEPPKRVDVTQAKPVRDEAGARIDGRTREGKAARAESA